MLSKLHRPISTVPSFEAQATTVQLMTLTLYQKRLQYSFRDMPRGNNGTCGNVRHLASSRRRRLIATTVAIDSGILHLMVFQSTIGQVLQELSAMDDMDSTAASTAVVATCELAAQRFMIASEQMDLGDHGAGTATISTRMERYNCIRENQSLLFQ